MADRRLKLLLDAINAIDLAVSFLAGQTLDAYSDNAMLRSSIKRQLEVLGEAFVRLTREEPSLFERLPVARSAIALRNRIIHGYDTLDDQTVHGTVARDLPTLRTALHAWLLELDPRA